MKNTGNAATREVNAGKRDRQTLHSGHLDDPNPERQADATSDAGVEAPTMGTTSDANGHSVSDQAAGEVRRQQHDQGVEFVSRID